MVCFKCKKDLIKKLKFSYFSEKIKHQNYYDIDMLNDIAIIKLSREVELNSKVQLACLPDRSEVPDAVPNDGDELYASGWGLINILQI